MKNCFNNAELMSVEQGNARSTTYSSEDYAKEQSILRLLEDEDYTMIRKWLEEDEKRNLKILA